MRNSPELMSFPNSYLLKPAPLFSNVSILPVTAERVKSDASNVVASEKLGLLGPIHDIQKIGIEWKTSFVLRWDNNGTMNFLPCRLSLALGLVKSYKLQPSWAYLE